MLTNSRKETEKPKKTQGGALTYSSFTKTQSFVYTPEIKTKGRSDKNTHHHFLEMHSFTRLSIFEMHTFTLSSFF